MSFRHLFRHALVLVLAASLPSAAAPESASEHAVRAVLMFNFIKFADLPGEGQEGRPLNVCIASADADLMAAMEQLRGRHVRGRPVAVEVLRRDAACDALYVDGRARWQALSDSPGTRAALTVGSYPGFLQDGGVVEVDFSSSRTRFDINNAQARRAGIRFYPQLLRLARRVLE